MVFKVHTIERTFVLDKEAFLDLVTSENPELYFGTPDIECTTQEDSGVYITA